MAPPLLPVSIIALVFVVVVSAWSPDGVANGLHPRITEAPVLVRQADSDSCWTSEPFESCIGPLNTDAGLCQGTAEASVYTSCACSTNSIYLPCWSSYCTADPLYSSYLSDFERDNGIFCSAGAGGGGSGPTTAGGSTPATTTPAAGAATTSSKTSGGMLSSQFNGELTILSSFAAAWLAAAAVLVL